MCRHQAAQHTAPATSRQNAPPEKPLLGRQIVPAHPIRARRIQAVILAMPRRWAVVVIVEAVVT